MSKYTSITQKKRSVKETFLDVKKHWEEGTLLDAKPGLGFPGEIFPEDDNSIKIVQETLNFIERNISSLTNCEYASENDAVLRAFSSVMIRLFNKRKDAWILNNDELLQWVISDIGQAYSICFLSKYVLSDDHVEEHGEFSLFDMAITVFDSYQKEIIKIVHSIIVDLQTITIEMEK